MPTYVASHISSDQNVLYPDVLEITDDKVFYLKGYVLGYSTITIQRRNISRISLHSGVFFADVIIDSNGGGSIRARGFKKSVAREIYNILI